MPEPTSNLVFGTKDRAIFGVMQSEGDKNNIEKANAKNCDGTMKEERAISKKRERTFEALLDSSVTMPAVGSIVSIIDSETETWTGLIDSIDKMTSNNEYAKYSITASKTDNANLMPLAAGAGA